MSAKVCRISMRLCAKHYRYNLTARMWDGDWQGRMETLASFLALAISWRKLSQTTLDNDYARQNRLNRN